MERSLSSVSFEAPDVRARCTLTLGTGQPLSHWFVSPGVNYQGVCPNPNCASQQEGGTICRFGLRDTFRPNEQFLEGEIKCRACGSSFVPQCYLFFKCSAQVNFRIQGAAANDQVSLSIESEDQARRLGEPGRTILYEMLRMKVEAPRVFQDVGHTDTVDAPGPSELRQQNDPISLSRLAPLCANFMRLNPQDIHYSQPSIAAVFQDGRSIFNTLNRLRSGALTSDEIETIKVFKTRNQWWSADNRRLWCFREAGLALIVVKIAKKRVAQQKFWFAQVNDGESIEIR